MEDMRKGSNMISIIIPIYNGEKYMRKCLNSITNQKYNDFEVLMIDDGSTDGSKEICIEYEKKDSRFKLFTKENGGSASARNLGLDLAKGDYISFIDVDDYIGKDFLFELYNAAQNNNSDIVICGFAIVSEEKKQHVLGDSGQIRNYTKHEIYKAFCEKKTYLSIAVLWNKIYKKEIFEDLRFPMNKGIDDEYLICQIINNANQITLMDKQLYFYYMSENSQMRNSIPSIKKIDNIEAIEWQLEFFININMIDIHDLLLYRYYSSVIDGYYYIKENFPEQKALINCLKRKKQSFYKVLFNRNIRISDKFLLIIRNYLPDVFEYVRGKVR